METVITVVLIVVIYGGVLVKVVFDGINRDAERAEQWDLSHPPRPYIPQAEWEQLTRLHDWNYRNNAKYRATAHYLIDRVNEHSSHIQMWGPIVYLMVKEYWKYGE